MLPHFIHGKGKLKLKLLPLKKYYISEILKRGIPELITQMSQPITIFCYNLIIIRYLGNIGVSDGIQPLISRSVGEGKKELEQYFLKKRHYFELSPCFLPLCRIALVRKAGHSHI